MGSLEPLDIYIYLSYGLVIVAAIGAIVLPLINALGDPKTLVKSGIGLLVLAVLFGISFLISSSEVTSVYVKFEVGPSLSRIVGGTIIMTYLLLGVSIVGIILTEVSKIFK